MRSRFLKCDPDSLDGFLDRITLAEVIEMESISDEVKIVIPIHLFVCLSVCLLKNKNIADVDSVMCNV